MRCREHFLPAGHSYRPGAAVRQKCGSEVHIMRLLPEARGRSKGLIPGRCAPMQNRDIPLSSGRR
jgi:hypothetical protein